MCNKAINVDSMKYEQKLNRKGKSTLNAEFSQNP